MENEVEVLGIKVDVSAAVRLFDDYIIMRRRIERPFLILLTMTSAFCLLMWWGGGWALPIWGRHQCDI
jgi:hypothetical protein